MRSRSLPILERILPAGVPKRRCARQNDHPFLPAVGVAVVAVRLPRIEISAEVEDRLASAVEASLPLEVVFDRVELLPGATCMLPLDDDALRRVTGDVLCLWPHLRSRLRTGRRRPYHLTVAATDDQGVHDEVRSALDPLLPITMRFASVQVVAHGDDADEVRPLATIRVDGPNRT